MGLSDAKSSNGVMIVRVEGQLVVGNRNELKEHLQGLLEKGERRFLIDFAHTGYIDSSGLGALVARPPPLRPQ